MKGIRKTKATAMVVVALSTTGWAQVGATGRDGARMGPEELIARLRGNLQFSQQYTRFMEGRSSTEVENFKSQIAAMLPAAVRDVFPTGIDAGAPDLLTKATAAAFLISEIDTEYNRAKMKLWLMSMNVDLALARKMQPLSTEDRQRLTANIADLKERAMNSMSRLLPQEFTRDEIVRHMNSWESHASAGLGDPFSYELRKPLNQSEIRDIGLEFERRLEAGLGRIAKRLARAEKMSDERGKAKSLEGTKAVILNELSSAAFAALRAYTTDQTVKPLDPNELVPGYNDAVRQCSKIEERLVAEGKTLFALQSKQRAQQRAHALLLKKLDPNMLDTIVANSLDTLVPPDEALVAVGQNVADVRIPPGTRGEEGHVLASRDARSAKDWWRSWTVQIAGLLVLASAVIGIEAMRKSRSHKQREAPDEP